MGVSKFRVRLWDTTGSGRGRGNFKADIQDAGEIGAAETANAAGECFFTLPWNHPAINEIQPLQRHIEIARWSASLFDWVPIWAGIMDDFDATKDEIVVYGQDYLSLYDGTISAANTSYTSATIGSIITDQVSAARAEPNSRVNFISIGSIDATTVTTTVLTSYQQRLQFISGLTDICAAGRSVRSIIQVSPRSSATPSFKFTENQGSNKPNVRLEYNALINDFHYRPGYADLRTRVNAIGQKREGATLLFSTQTYASETAYGWLATPTVFIDIVDQAALDKRTLRTARQVGRIPKNVAIALTVHGLAPWDGYDLGDSVPLTINRGIISLSGAYFTIWGQEWTGHKDGSETLHLSLLPQDT